MSATVIKALIKAKKQFKELKKSATNPAFKVNGKPAPYSTIDDVAEATAPLLDNGLYLSQQPVNIDGKPWLKAILYHDSGEFLDMGEIPISVIERTEVSVNSSKEQGNYPKFKNIDATVTEHTDVDPQKMTGSITYARRAQKCAIFDLNGDIDDDGNQASGVSGNGYQSKSNGYQSNNNTASTSAVNGKQLYAAGMKAFNSDGAKLSAYLKSNGVPSGNTNHVKDKATFDKLMGEFKAMESKQEVDF